MKGGIYLNKNFSEAICDMKCANIQVKRNAYARSLLLKISVFMPNFVCISVRYRPKWIISDMIKKSLRKERFYLVSI